MEQETRIVVISIIVEDKNMVSEINQLLHEYGEFIIGRMGLPYEKKGVNIISRCKKAGLIMTKAGATYPYGKDPHDSNIRIAPSYPPLSDLRIAMELFALCVKLTSVDKLLKDMQTQENGQ